MKSVIFRLTIIAISLFFGTEASATIKLPSFISDNMILQQNKPNRIWGWADAGKIITISFDGKTYSAIANQQGEWQAFLQPTAAGAKGSIVLSSANDRVEIKNVLAGEIWICSGQSNMEWKMNMLGDTYKTEMATALNDNLRYITIEKSVASTPQKNVTLEKPWSPINSTTIGDCSAVAYWYGKKLQEELKVPVGLIITSWGGTPAEAWTSYEGLQQFPHYQKIFTDRIMKLDLENIDEVQKKLRATFQQNAIQKNKYIHEASLATFCDEKWKTMPLPGPWESQGYPGLDGIVMYRMMFTVDAADAGKAAVLNMPAIDDVDSTYINGDLVGTMSQWDAKRSYKIAPGVLKAGQNLLAIVVQDNGGGGGLANEPSQFNLTIGDKKISLQGNARYDIIAELKDVTGGIGGAQNAPATLYNAMIAPLLSLSFRGAIWYQGESNADRAIEYRSLFPAMITDWRNRFSQGEFPFLFVQLSSFGKVNPEPSVVSNWALLREAQQMTLSLPNTAMAVSTDVGNPGNIHPVQKKEVGERLAAGSLAKFYNNSSSTYASHTGPVYKSMKIQGNKIVLQFIGVGKGLFAKGTKLNEFSIAGADKKFYWADAVIVGSTVVVTSKEVKTPVAVRYGWSESPITANLFNKEGYPASPFRTDAW
jgi:sialate O-acetylesterase